MMILRSEEMDDLSYGKRDIYSQGVIWAFDHLSKEQLQSIIPSYDLNKKIEDAIKNKNVKKYCFYQGAIYYWKAMYDSFTWGFGYKINEIQKAILKRALGSYKYANPDNLIYYDKNFYSAYFGINYGEKFDPKEADVII